MSSVTSRVNELVAGFTKQLSSLLAEAERTRTAVLVKGKAAAKPSPKALPAPAAPVKAKHARMSPSACEAVRKAIMATLRMSSYRKFGLCARELLAVVPAGTTRLALAHQINVLKGLGLVEQVGERKLAVYRRLVVKKG